MSSTEALDLGREFRIDLGDLSLNRGWTINQLIASLEATTTLTKLTIWVSGFESTPDNKRRIIEPLCRCIANLRSHNPNHPLRTLEIFQAVDDEYVALYLRPLLEAAKLAIQDPPLGIFPNESPNPVR